MFISPSVFSPSCAVWASLFPSLRLCATLSIIAIGQLLSKHCNLAAGCCSSRTSNIPNLLMSGTRPPVVSAPAARMGWLSAPAAPAARLLWLLGCSAALAALAACPLWLLAFIPYAKVKKLILTHYILFIWKDRCMFFSDAAFPSRMLFFPLPDGSPWQQHLCHSAASRHRAPASSISATAAPLASSIFLMALRLSAPASSSATAPPLCSRSATAPRPAALPQRPSQQLCHGSASLQSLRHGVPASNKPHPAEKSTPVWLAIWRIWAGFANSQHRDAAFATPDNICAHSSFLQH